MFFGGTNLFLETGGADRPKRIGIGYYLQITSHERHLHLGAADGAPGFEQLVDDIAANFGVVGTQAVQEDMHDWNGDWDILYPFSAVSKLPSKFERFALLIAC
jgi:hypothetical protein